MEIRQLKYFVTLCHAKSYTRAAAELFITQPTLSQQITTLESGIGLSLIDHSKKMFRLTETGETFLELAESFLVQYERFEKEVDNLKLSQNYTLSYASLAAVNAFFTPDLFESFKNAYPNIQIIHSTTVFSNLVSFVKEKLVDISMAMTYTHKEYEGIKKIILHEYDDQLVIIVPKTSEFSSVKSFDDPLFRKLLTKNCHLYDGWRDYELPLSILKKINPAMSAYSYYNNLIEFLSRPYDWDGFTIIPELHLHIIQGASLFHIIYFPNNECSLDVSLLYNPTNTNPAVKMFIDEIPENIIFHTPEITSSEPAN